MPLRSGENEDKGSMGSRTSKGIIAPRSRHPSDVHAHDYNQSAGRWANICFCATSPPPNSTTPASVRAPDKRPIMQSAQTHDASGAGACCMLSLRGGLKSRVGEPRQSPKIEHRKPHKMSRRLPRRKVA